jgi:hypothetical protein
MPAKPRALHCTIIQMWRETARFDGLIEFWLL